MKSLRQLYPVAFRATDFKHFLISLLFYLAGDLITGVAIGVLALIPFLGSIFSTLGVVIAFYFFLGIAITLLVFLGLFKPYD